MEKSSRVALIIAICLLVFGGLLYFGNRNSPKTPDALIRETLQDAEIAAKNGDINGVMESVSDDFDSSGVNKARLRLLLSRSLSAGRNLNYSVHIDDPKIAASPRAREDERMVITRFAAFDLASGQDYYKTKNAVMLIMREETRRRYLIFREPKWRIVSILNLPALEGGSMDEDIGF